MEVDHELRQAEMRRVEAERLKLELEAKEIERRISVRWWRSNTLPRYVVGVVITGALLFGWARAYLEPILRREGEINQLAERRNATLNQLLEAQASSLRKQHEKLIAEASQLRDEQGKLNKEKKRLAGDRDRLLVELRDQERDRKHLELNVEGLKIAVDQAAAGKGKFFSILNRGDPITELRNAYGWKMYSDNRIGWLGYYLIISHEGVPPEQGVIVGRVFEIDDLKRRRPDSWRQVIKDVAVPILALDYTYLGLLADKTAPVGGILYDQGKEIEFSAPLSKWSDKLGKLLAKR